MMMAKREASCMERYVEIETGVMLHVKDADGKSVPFEYEHIRHGDIAITIDVKEMRKIITNEIVQKINEANGVTYGNH